MALDKIINYVFDCTMIHESPLYYFHLDKNDIASDAEIY